MVNINDEDVEVRLKLSIIVILVKIRQVKMDFIAYAKAAGTRKLNNKRCKNMDVTKKWAWARMDNCIKIKFLIY